MIEFAKFTKAEAKVVERIVTRARTRILNATRLELTMDLAATHAKIPLRLQELLEADDFDFFHDVAGIHAHMNRTTGELGDCFVPRFAQLCREGDSKTRRARIREGMRLREEAEGPRGIREARKP